MTSFTGGNTATDHNGYNIGNRYYVSHYKRGLVIFDSTNPDSQFGKHKELRQAMLYAMEREWLPIYKLDWRTHRRLRFRLDDEA